MDISAVSALLILLAICLFIKLIPFIFLFIIACFIIKAVFCPSNKIESKDK